MSEDLIRVLLAALMFVSLVTTLQLVSFVSIRELSGRVEALERR